MKNKPAIFRLLLLVLLTANLVACGTDTTAVVSQVLPTATPSPLALPTATATPALLPTARPVPARVIVLDPGHGGDDWGGFHTNADDKIDVLEKEVVLQIAQKTAESLQAVGYKVILTRTEDVLANDPPRDLNADGEIGENDDLYARIEIANQSKADLFISLHLNASDLGNDADGAETWYCADRPFGAQNQRLAELVQQETITALKGAGYAVQNRKVGEDIELGDHIAVLGPTNDTRKVATTMPGVLSEALFITNDTEAALLQDPKIIAALAGGYSNAIQKYFKVG